MSLKLLSDQELVVSTGRALKVVREAEVEALRHFQEIEDRKLWVEAGSLYKYIASSFGLTADQIYPRLQAMRLMRAIPEVEEKLEEGQLTITNALKAHQVFAAESKQRLVSEEEKREILENLENVSTKEADKLLAEKYPESKKPPEKVKPVAKNQNLIQFYVDDETLKQIEELKAKYSHQMPSGKMEDLMKILIQQVNRQAKPKIKQRPELVQSAPKTQVEAQREFQTQVQVPAQAQIQAPTQAQVQVQVHTQAQIQSPKRITVRKARSRYISAEVKRAMEITRVEGCAYINAKTGERCGSKHFLQRDHIQEYSQGGSNEIQNLRWLCGFHNRHRFETNSGAKSPYVRPEDYEGIDW